MKYWGVLFLMLISLTGVSAKEKRADFNQWDLNDLEIYLCDRWWAEIDNPNGMMTTGTMTFTKDHKWSFKGYAVYDVGTWGVTLKADGQYRIHFEYLGTQRPEWAGGALEYLVFADTPNLMVWSTDGRYQFLHRIHRK